MFERNKSSLGGEHPLFEIWLEECKQDGIAYVGDFDSWLESVEESQRIKRNQSLNKTKQIPAQDLEPF